MARHDALLHARWRAAMSAVSTCDAVEVDDALEAVLSRHREPHRQYHGEVHVARVVEDVHRLAAADTHPPIDIAPLVLAAVFHDAVYDPTSATNEADSADLAERTLQRLGVETDDIERVRTSILATAGHFTGSEPPDPTTAIVLDADLAVLGADPAEYAAYVEGVRAEYAHLSDDEWRQGRRRVLDALLAREPLYATAEGRRLWEARARGNLTAERRALDAPE